MIIREFTEQDIEEITFLMKKLCELKGQDFNVDRWKSSLKKEMKKDTNSEVLVAFDDNNEEVLGMGHCSVRTADNGFRFGYISNLIVKEEKRRSGIGEKLMKNIIEYFRRNHIHSIRLALKTNLNEGATLLFRKLGFQEILKIYELVI